MWILLFPWAGFKEKKKKRKEPPQEAQESTCKAGDVGSVLGWQRFPGEGNGKPFSVFLPEKFYGQRSLAGSPNLRGHKELDMTEHAQST